jgi:hypothetical protein
MKFGILKFYYETVHTIQLLLQSDNNSTANEGQGHYIII